MTSRRGKVYQQRKAKASKEEDELNFLENQLNRLGYQIAHIGKGTKVDYIGVTGKVHRCEALEPWAVYYNGNLYVEIQQQPVPQLRWPFAATRKGAIEYAIERSTKNV